MYSYIEQEKVDGKNYRTGGVTKRSLKAMKHLPKIGVPQSVRGYVYRGRYNACHIGVMVKGDKGKIRFGGFSWGYSGEGCRGLAELFVKLGIRQDQKEALQLVENIAESPNFDKPMECWKIDLTPERDK